MGRLNPEIVSNRNNLQEATLSSTALATTKSTTSTSSATTKTTTSKTTSTTTIVPISNPTTKSNTIEIKPSAFSTDSSSGILSNKDSFFMFTNDLNAFSKLINSRTNTGSSSNSFKIGSSMFNTNNLMITDNNTPNFVFF